MIASIELEQIDQILDQLESLSLTAQSKREFYEVAISRLQTLLRAQTVTYLIRVGSHLASKSWSPVAEVGDSHMWHEAGSLCNQIDAENSWTLSDDRQLLLVSKSQTGHPDAIVAARLAHRVDPTAAKDLVQLMQAFAEILDLRNQREKELFLKDQFPRLQYALGVLAQATDLQQAAMIIANELQDVFCADRVTLAVSNSGRTPQILAVSGVARKILPTETATEIQRVCHEAKAAGRPVLRTSKPGEHSPQSVKLNNGQLLAPCIAAFPLCTIAPQLNSETLTSVKANKDIDQTYIMFEWSDPEKFLTSLSVMSTVLPTLAPIWQAQSRWLRQPSILRILGSSSVLIKQTLNRWIVRTSVAIVGLAIAVWVLTRPAEFRIEIPGTLEPVLQQTIYAAHDGYIDQLLVADNSQVQKGQQVAMMRSPELELQIQEARGQIRANQERRNALSLSLNQISDTQSVDSQSRQQTVGSEIRQVDIQRQSMEQRLEALVRESEKLKLTAPIQGVIISREIVKSLESRPIRRGDAVVRVVDPAANWRLALRIKDSDVGHVKQHLSDFTSLGNDRVEFVLVSNPAKQHHARLSWLANSSRNPDGQGVIVDAHADIDQSIEMAQIGATVQAYIYCGQRPLWYVWSRPLLETIQRKLWF